MHVTRVGIYKFLRVYEATDTIQRRPDSGRPSKITSEVKVLVEQQMIRDDETTASQLHRLLLENWILFHSTRFFDAERIWDGHFEDLPIAS